VIHGGGVPRDSGKFSVGHGVWFWGAQEMYEFLGY
jgi:hypothetical protein